MFSNFFRKIEKYVGARGATNDVTIWRIRVVFLIRKAARMHPHAHTYAYTHRDLYIILSAFHGNCYRDAFQCYGTGTLTV